MSNRPTLLVCAAIAACLLSPAAAGAAEGLALRGDVVAQRDSVTLGELVEGAPASLAETPLFRAPALGQSGTIQARRIVEAAAELGIAAVESGGRMQVTITRATRHVGGGEIEAVLRKALAEQAGLDPASTGIQFDGPSPSLAVAPEMQGAVGAADLAYDRRTRRLTATIWIGRSVTERRASLRVAGAVVELVEVAVLTRGLERGETVRPTDLAVERRPRDAVSSDSLLDGATLQGRVARRALAAGGLVRAGDLVRPELVARGEIVTVVYEAPGITLSLRAKASEAGALGDAISVVNPGTKKAFQATIVGPGKVSVSGSPSARIVAAAAATSATP